MPFHLPRRQVPHFERPGGVVCLTWRVDRHRPILRPEERTIVFEVIQSCEPAFAELLAAVVMDDHVHVLVRPRIGTTGRRLVRALKVEKSLGGRKLFGPLDLHKVWLTVHARNAAAIHAYEAVGFRVEGTHRGEFLLDGARLDEIYMGILKTDRP